jgi:hypothetical protein
MIEVLIANARQLDLETAERTIAQRREWESISLVEKLERALRAARTRVRFVPSAQAG